MRGFPAKKPCILRVSGASAKSRKHSSRAKIVPVSRHRSRMRRSSARSVVLPVGLLGWHRKTSSVSGVIQSKKLSVRQKPFSAVNGNRSTRQSWSRSAPSYSENAGAVSSALCGRTAMVSRNSKSDAPFPQRIHSAGSCTPSPSASRSSRHMGSGYSAPQVRDSVTACLTPSGIPRGLTLAEKSSGFFPYSSA